jgi:hypothetical protein
MSFEINWNSKNNIVEARVNDLFNYDLLDRMAPGLVQMLKEKNSRLILIDFRKSKISMSTMKIYDIPTRLSKIFNEQGVDIKQIKRAILITQQDDDFKFLDDVSFNSRHLFKLFYDEDSAINWLLS